MHSVPGCFFSRGVGSTILASLSEAGGNNVHRSGKQAPSLSLTFLMQTVFGMHPPTQLCKLAAT